MAGEEKNRPLENGFSPDKWYWINRKGIFEDENLAAFAAPFPPAHLMQKAYGICDKKVFADHGAEIYKALVSASGKNFGQFKNILVLNCGCGILLRYLKGHSGKITACDGNEENIEWITNHLQFVHAVKIDTKVGLPFSDNQFDAVIVLSVFTFLSRPVQKLLIQELHRLTSDSGSVFIPLYGAQTITKIQKDPECIGLTPNHNHASKKARKEFEQNRHVFVSKTIKRENYQIIGEKIKKAAEKLFIKLKSRVYEPALTFISTGYLQKHWENWFRIDAIYKGTIHDFQDILVATPKKETQSQAVKSGLKTVQDRCCFSEKGFENMTNSVRILSFKKYTSEIMHLCDFHIDHPSSSETFKNKPFGFSGWIVGKNISFNTVEIFSNGDHLLSIPVEISRPDVVKHFNLSSANDHLGFAEYVNPFFLSRRFEIEGFAMSPEVGKIKLFQITGERKVLTCEREMDINPLFITTLGRTGSTFLLGLLGAHPKISVYRPFQVEARYASYWLQMFLSFSHPKSWVFPVAAYNVENPAWIMGDEKATPLHHALYPEIVPWFDGNYTQDLFNFCTRSLERHYDNVARIQHKPNARFFSEKLLPNAFTDAMIDLLPGAKEIVLTRDFRDMFCSIRAFNQKRGFQAFGRDQFSTDEDYISQALAGGANALMDAWKKRKASSVLVRYEDLIQDTESILISLFSHLGIDASSAVVGEVIKNAGKTAPKSQENHKTTSCGKASLQRFRQELSPELLSLCNRVFQEPLITFGYDL